MNDAEWIIKQQIEIKDKEIDRLQAENKRLRGLLRGVLLTPIAEVDTAEKDAEIERLRDLVRDLHQCGDISPDLWDRIKKEVGDE